MSNMLPNGVYEIRFVPMHINVPFVGGLYATGESLNAPILARPLNQSMKGEQHWKIQAVEGKKDTFMITYPGFSQSGASTGHGPVIPGFGLGAHRGHNETVRLTVDIAELIITPVDPKLGGVFHIKLPADGMVGAVRAITEEHSQLMIKSFPVIRDMPPLPQWEFIHVGK